MARNFNFKDKQALLDSAAGGYPINCKTSSTTLYIDNASGIWGSAQSAVPGDAIVVFLVWDNITATTPTVTMSGGTNVTWTTLVTSDSHTATSAGGVRTAIALGALKNSASSFESTDTITATFSSAIVSKTFGYVRLRGIDLDNPVVTSSETTASGASGSSISLTTGVSIPSGSLVMTCLGHEQNTSINLTDLNFDIVNDANVIGGGGAANVALRSSARRILSSGTVTYAPSAASTADWSASMVAFRAASGFATYDAPERVTQVSANTTSSSSVVLTNTYDDTGLSSARWGISDGDTEFLIFSAVHTGTFTSVTPSGTGWTQVQGETVGVTQKNTYYFWTRTASWGESASVTISYSGATIQNVTAMLHVVAAGSVVQSGTATTTATTSHTFAAWASAPANVCHPILLVALGESGSASATGPTLTKTDSWTYYTYVNQSTSGTVRDSMAQITYGIDSSTFKDLYYSSGTTHTPTATSDVAFSSRSYSYWLYPAPPITASLTAAISTSASGNVTPAGPQTHTATASLTAAISASAVGYLPASEKSATTNLVVYPASAAVVTKVIEGVRCTLTGYEPNGIGSSNHGLLSATTRFVGSQSSPYYIDLVLVIIVQDASSTNETTGVTCGGTTATFIDFVGNTSEAGGVAAYYARNVYAGSWSSPDYYALIEVTRTGTNNWIAATYGFDYFASGTPSTDLIIQDTYKNFSTSTTSMLSTDIVLPDTLAWYGMVGGVISGIGTFDLTATGGASQDRVMDFGTNTGWTFDTYNSTQYAIAGNQTLTSWGATQAADDAAWLYVAVGANPPKTSEALVLVRPIVEAHGNVIPYVGPVTHTATAAITVAPTPVITLSGIPRSSDAAVTVAPTVSASGIVTDSATAAITLAQTVSASGLVTDTATAAITLAASMSASGVVTDTATAALTLAPATSASGIVTGTATAAITFSPTTSAAGTTQVIHEATADVTMGYTVSADLRSTKFVTAAITTDTTEVASGLVTDTATAAVTAGLSVSATGLVTDTATAAITSTTTQSASGLVTDTATVSVTAGITVSASGFTTQSGSLSLTSTPTVSASGIVIDSATAAITTSPTVSATGLVTDTATAAITLAPSTSATGLVDDYATAALTVSPTVTATGVTTKSVTAAVTVDPIVTATAGAIARTSDASLLVTPLTTALGIAYVSRFLRPDALLSMSGLTGTYLDIQDSPTSPDANALTPTGGPIDVRMSFENDAGNMRLGTNDQVIRVLLTVP